MKSDFELGRRSFTGFGIGLAVLVATDLAHAGRAAPASQSTRGRAVAELEAVRKELVRGIEQLRLEDGPAPYEATARLVRARSLTLDASYGGIVTDLLENQAFGSVGVRVGSLDRDNGNFFGGLQEGSFSLPLEPSPAATRRKVWLGMDAAFRGATAAYSAKESAIDRTAGEEFPPDRVPAPAPKQDVAWAEAAVGTDLATAHAPEHDPAVFDRAGLRDLVTQLSQRFTNHPRVDNGDVVMQLVRSDRATVTSAGTVLAQRHDQAVLAVLADMQAADGMTLDHGAAIHLRGLPTADESLRAQAQDLVDQVLRELLELADAPMLDEDYDGPVLFGAVAAAQLLASTVAVHAIGTPSPWSEFGRITDLEPHWLDRLGRGVMPDWVELWDDPGLAGGFGSYAVDAEGVDAEKVQMVRSGVLHELLMSRTPNDDIRKSNGRARMTNTLGVAPSISNLALVSKRRGLDSRGLERDLLRRAREDGYDYAYVVESLRDSNVLGPVPRDSAMDYGSGRKVSLPIPSRVFRIGSGGSRTLVRGALIAPVSMRALRRIRAVGRTPVTVPMRLPPGISGGFNAGIHVEAMLSQTVDCQVRTPALLVEGMELVVERGEHDRLPTLIHPLRRGSGTGEASDTDDGTEG